MIKYNFFWSGEFSNFYKCNFIYKDINFSNTEQAFMYEKAMIFNDLEIANRILKTFDPKKVKELGRMIKNYDDSIWIKNRVDIMYDVNYAKYSQNPKLMKLLLSNENYVEASPYDKIWGIGMKIGDDGIENPSNWKGSNLLGEVLNKLRDDLKNIRWYITEM